MRQKETDRILKYHFSSLSLLIIIMLTRNSQEKNVDMLKTRSKKKYRKQEKVEIFYVSCKCFKVMYQLLAVR